MKKNILFSYKAILLLVLFIFNLPYSVAELQSIDEALLSEKTEMACHFNADVSMDCIATVRYQILKLTGRDMISLISFSYPQKDKFEVISANVTQPGEKPVPLGPDQIETKMQQNPQEGLSSNKTTSLIFENLKLNSYVSYTVRHHYAAEAFIPHHMYRYYFRPQPVRVDEFKAVYTSDRPLYHYAYHMDDFLMTASQDQKKWKIKQKKPIYINYINELSNSYITSHYFELGTSTDLQENYGPLAEKYHAIISAALPSKAAHQVEAIKVLSEHEKVKKIMEFIYHSYRYLGDWRNTDRGKIPFDLATIEQHGYGDCKDLAVLLTAMLRASGIQASTALVSRGARALPLKIPGAEAPNHAIVQARVDGKIWWLDPTNPVFSGNYAFPDIQNRWVLIFNSDGKVTQDHIPEYQPKKEETKKVVIVFKPEAPANIDYSMSMIKSIYLARLNIDDRQYGEKWLDKIICNAVGKEQTHCKVKRPTSEFELPERYDVSVQLEDNQAFIQLSQDRYLYKASRRDEVWDEVSDYLQKGGLWDLYFEEPMKSDKEVTLIAKGIDANEIHDCQIQSDAIDFSLYGTKIPEGYRYHIQSHLKKSWLTHDEIVDPAFQGIVKKMKKCLDQLNFIVNVTPVSDNKLSQEAGSGWSDKGHLK